jgi:hypothetical protein
MDMLEAHLHRTSVQMMRSPASTWVPIHVFLMIASGRSLAIWKCPSILP